MPVYIDLLKCSQTRSEPTETKLMVSHSLWQTIFHLQLQILFWKLFFYFIHVCSQSCFLCFIRSKAKKSLLSVWMISAFLDASTQNKMFSTRWGQFKHAITRLLFFPYFKLLIGFFFLKDFKQTRVGNPDTLILWSITSTRCHAGSYMLPV